MKKKNAGLSTVEVIVAAVILAVVIIGVLVVVRMVSKDDERTNAADAEKIITSLADHVAQNVSTAMLDVSYSGDTLRVVNRDAFHLYYFDTAAGQVKYKQKNYMNPDDTEENKIKAANATSIATDTSETIAENVTTFHATIGDLKVQGASVVLKLRVVTDAENVNKEVVIPIHRDLIAYKNGNYIPPTPTPEATPTEDPNVTPTSTPSPTPSPKSEPVTGVISGKKNGPLPMDKMQAAPAGATIRVNLRCADPTKAPEGYGVGGLAIDTYTIEGSRWEVFADGKQEKDVVYSFDFDLDEMLSLLKAAEGKEIYINAYNGYSIESVEIIAP